MTITIEFSCGHVKEAWLPSFISDGAIGKIREEMAQWGCEACGLVRADSELEAS